MANFNIAYDNDDKELGNYFYLSKKDILDFINNLNSAHLVNEMPSSRCNEAYIDMYFPKINHNNFIFVAYSHGNNENLCANGNWYISAPQNTHIFINSLFYAMACNAGLHMGLELITKGCHSFVGYRSNAFAIINCDYEQLSIECDNHAIKRFIEGHTIGEAVASMRHFFSEAIKELIRKKEPLIAAYLRKNQAALILHGDENITFKSF